MRDRRQQHNNLRENPSDKFHCGPTIVKRKVKERREGGQREKERKRERGDKEKKREREIER